MTPTPRPPADLERALDPQTWDLDVPTGLAERAVTGVDRARRRRRGALAATAAVAAVVAGTGTWALVRDPAPPDGPVAVAASSPGAPGVDLDGWTFTPPAGCRALDSESSSTVNFGPQGINSSGVAPAADELRVRLSGFSYECAGSILSVTRIDPLPVPGSAGLSPLGTPTSRTAVVRTVAAITVDPGHPDAALSGLRTRVTSEGNAVRATVPDPAWGVFAVHVAGGDPARIDPLVDSLRRTG